MRFFFDENLPPALVIVLRQFAADEGEGDEYRHLTDADGSRLMVAVESDTFFETTYWRLGRGAPQRINLPPKSTIQGLHKVVQEKDARIAAQEARIDALQRALEDVKRSIEALLGKS